MWHSWFRARYFFQVLQQNGYHINEYAGWLRRNWAGKLIGNAHAIIIPIFLIEMFGNKLTMTSITIILFLFVSFLFLPGRREYTGLQKKPVVFTPRMIRLAIPVALLYLFFPWLGYTQAMRMAFPTPDALIITFSFILADLLIPFYILLASILMHPVEKFIQDGFKKRARRKIRSMPDLKVVAITGSYGKTSTKFIIKTLLEERFNVCFTPGSYNTPMGICKVINNDLNAQHQVLVLEMGARYEGNIDELCEIARPDVAIVTNVGKAHLETFGSVEAIARTKGALVRHLKPGGTAILNGDDPLVAAMAGRTDITTITAGIGNGDFRASDISYDESGCRFTVHLPEGETMEVTTALLGIHNVQNMLLGIAAGTSFGLRPGTIQVAARRVEPVEHRLELKRANGLLIIDDAFNSNPVGARNAVDVLSRFKTGRRVIITPGMVELGELEEAENREFGRHIGRAGLDLVILVGGLRSKPIIDGIRESGYPEDQVRIAATLFEAREILAGYARDGDVVLYENDLPDIYDEKA
ncbi:MAG: UDP-N-acetylmuramoyl-tripeptide--D-alanyl-D-alanine ligase [Balneolaceae bacterium]|nr:MAG: UDP-N-acetylmuramoyl-tripeptide--D-alanyl-D-alanine ligase [Balneolaceae bacterium]